MKKTKITININEFPKEIQYLLENTTIYDSSSNPDMQVLYSEKGYYIKIAGKDTLKKEAQMTRIFESKGIGAKVAAFISEDKDYLVTEVVKGNDGLEHLNEPEKLCEALAEAMRYLHNLSIENVPVSVSMKKYEALENDKIKSDTFIHGDFCLPNIMLENWKLISFIDVGESGVGDKHIDLFWAMWSLAYNLKTEEYNDLFLDLYGRDKADMELLALVEKMELKDVAI